MKDTSGSISLRNLTSIRLMDELNFAVSMTELDFKTKSFKDTCKQKGFVIYRYRYSCIDPNAAECESSRS